MAQYKYEYPPGSPQAVADGCTCPVMDNARGKGCGYVDLAGMPLYVYDASCPLHGSGKAEKVQSDEAVDCDRD